MDKGTKNYFDEHNEKSPISKFKILQDGMLKTKILNVGTISSNFSNIETASCKPSIVAVESPQCLSDNIGVSNSITVKPDSIVSTATSKISFPATSKTTFSATSKINSPKLLRNLTKSMFGVEELLESINLQTEETEEMLDMVSRAKEKLEFFISHVECLVKSLQEISELPATNSIRGNTYVKNMYRKKLEEFASRLLGKIKRSIKDLEVEYGALKEQENKISETSEKITKFHQISNNAENGKETLLNETVNQLLEEICSLKSKQLSEIEKVSYIETDIEMLYDLYRRFSSIEGLNLISAFNFM